MSLQRKLRRQEQKKNGTTNGLPPGNPFGMLQKTLGDLKQFQGLGEMGKDLVEKLQEVQGVVNELTGLRDDLKVALEEAGDVKVELERQRMVFLRFLSAPDLFVGPGDYVNKFLATEARYRAEYDAMLLLVSLVTWAKEAP